MKTWLKGGLIGLIISVFSTAGLFLCGFVVRGEGGLICLYFTMPQVYLLRFTGLEYLTALLNLDVISLWAMIIGSIAIIFLGFLLGFLFDKEINLKKKLIVGIVVIILIASLLGNNFYLKSRDKKIIDGNVIQGTYWETADLETCNKISVFNRFQKHQCYLRLIEIEPSLELCLKLNIEIQRDDCYTALAKSNKDPNLCDKTATWKKDICYRDLASLTADEKLCEKIDGSKIECYISVAKVKKDPNICRNLEEGQEDCYQEVAVASNNPQLCEELKDNIKTMLCYTVVASRLRDSSICENINEEAFKNDCYSNIGVY